MIVLICALINSIGYACGMGLGQREFLESYNHIYADKMGLTEVDANASAGPMKILQNLGIQGSLSYSDLSYSEYSLGVYPDVER